MNKILRLIKEEIGRLIKEYSDDKIYDLYDKRDDIKSNILNDFLFNNNPTFTKRIGWKLLPAPRLKKIWEDYIRTGIVRDEKGIDMISSIMITNILKLDILTYLSGHSQYNPDEDFEDAWGGYIDNYIENLTHKTNIIEKNILFDEFINNQDDLDDINIKENLMEILMDQFYTYYAIDKKGIVIMSDYGLKPLLNLVIELVKEDDKYEKILVIIDKMLNIAHQRSDLASWFIEGGSSALSNISGYYSAEDYSWDSSSVISGKYRLSDYH